MRRWDSLRTARVARGALLAALLTLLGCGKKDGLSDNDRRMQGIQNAREDLKSKGAKVEDRKYAQGSALAVSLTGMEVNEQLLKQVRSLGIISELNLSKTTLNDDHMALLNELELCVLCVKIDLSNTAITDAGFQKLEKLRFLSQMNLTGTKVSRAAVDGFMKKRETDANVPAMFRKPTIQVN